MFRAMSEVGRKLRKIFGWKYDKVELLILPKSRTV